MPKEQLEDLSLDKLKKRKRLSVALLCMLIFAVALSIVVLILNLIKGIPLNVSVIGGAIPPLFFALYFYLVIRRINEEISRRKSQ